MPEATSSRSLTLIANILIPVFWDPIFLAKKNAVMAALGARYHNHPAVKIVVASFANATTGGLERPAKHRYRCRVWNK